MTMTQITAAGRRYQHARSRPFSSARAAASPGSSARKLGLKRNGVCGIDRHTGFATRFKRPADCDRGPPRPEVDHVVNRSILDTARLTPHRVGLVTLAP